MSIEINKEILQQFFHFMQEREKIRLLKESGAEKPWTQDAILSSYKFTNINREDDRTTVWYRENLRNEFDGTPDVFNATIIFRWFNLIATGATLKKAGVIPVFNKQKAVEALQGSPQIFTGAYIIRSETGKSKLESICDCIELMLSYRTEILNGLKENGPSLEWMTNKLTEFPMMGGFMAYEVVTDLRHTYLLKDAPDIMTWANPGPGAMRGILRLHGLPVKASASLTGRGKNKSWFIQMIRTLLPLVQEFHDKYGIYGPNDNRKFEMRDVEHSLCEFDKYLRVLTGEGTPRSKYAG